MMGDFIDVAFRPGDEINLRGCGADRVHQDQIRDFSSLLGELTRHLVGNNAADTVADQKIWPVHISGGYLPQVSRRHFFHAFGSGFFPIGARRAQAEKAELFADMVEQSRINQKFSIAAVSTWQKTPEFCHAGFGAKRLSV
jgi:hypothetical protein